MKAAGYVRVSSKHQTENESLDTQEAQIRGFITANGWELIEPIYKDAGISGRKASRPDLDRLMADAVAGAFQVVLVADLSRFGRSTKDVLNNVDRLKKANIKFVSIRERLDGTGPYGEFMLQVFSAIAELESKTIELRTRENRESLVEQGKRFIGGLPYGYGRKPKQNKDEPLEIILIPEEVKIYNKIIEFYLDHKMSIEGIAVELNRLGYRSRTGKMWNTTTINSILRHPAHYLGILQTKANGKTVTFNCPKLISKARWDEIQRKLMSNNKRPGRPDNKSATHLLNKLLYCGICGSRMASSIDRDAGRRFYSCYWHELSERARLSRNKQYCPQPRHDAEELEEQVMKTLVQSLLYNPLTLVLSLVESVENDDLQGKIMRLQAEFNGCENRIKNINLALNSPNLNPIVIAHHNGNLAVALEEKARIGVELDEARVEAGRREDEAKNVQLLMDFLTVNKERLDDYRDFLMELPFEEKQKLIKGMLRDDKIIITPMDVWLQDDKNVGREIMTFGENLTQQDLDNPENDLFIDAKFRFNLPILKDVLKDKFAASETSQIPKEIISRWFGKAGSRSRQSCRHRQRAWPSP